MPDHDPDAQRISRRSLLRLQLARWAGDATEPRPARARRQPLPRVLEPVAETLLAAAGVAAGMEVLDVGSGDSAVALAAVRRGATVTACDSWPAAVERGRADCPTASWVLAEAADLPFADGAFDAVVSAFGVTLAPSLARELVRVTCPGAPVAVAVDGREDVARATFGPLLDELKLDTGVVALRSAGPGDAGAIVNEARYLLVCGWRPIPQA